MKNKSVTLEWYVLYHNFNTNKIQTYNIFSKSFTENIYIKIKSKKINNYEQLKQEIDQYCKYHYLSKSEFEVAMGGLFSKYPQEFEKIDIYTQIQPNLDNITKYIINEMNIKF